MDYGLNSLSWEIRSCGRGPDPAGWEYLMQSLTPELPEAEKSGGEGVQTKPLPRLYHGATTLLWLLKASRQQINKMFYMAVKAHYELNCTN